MVPRAFTFSSQLLASCRLESWGRVFSNDKLWRTGQSVCLIIRSVDAGAWSPLFTARKEETGNFYRLIHTFGSAPLNPHHPCPVYSTSLCTLLSNTSWGWRTCLPRRQACVIFQRGVWCCCSGPIKATDQTNSDGRCLFFLPLKRLNMYNLIVHLLFNPLSLCNISHSVFDKARRPTMLYIQTAFKRLWHRHTQTCAHIQI